MVWVGNVLLGLMAAFNLLHILVIVGAVPYKYVWGGRLNSHKQAIKKEIFAIIVMLVLMWIVAMHIGMVAAPISLNIVKYLMWGMTGFFVLNTVANLAAKTKLEKYGFAFLTSIMASLSFILTV